jgi:NAD(P)H-dependent FMN reductase
VLVTPEYNRGVSAPLKNALDYLYAEWAYKPVGFVSYGMTSAGLRAAEMIKPVLTALRMVAVPDGVSIRLRQRLDAQGILAPDEVMAEAADDVLAELHLLAATLRPLRLRRAHTLDAVAS